MREKNPERRAKTVLLVLAAFALISMAAFMTLGAKGSWSFVLPFRGIKLLSLLLVAYAIAVSTILFQTVTNNRILTPSVMGFDSLYVLMQTGLIFVFGSATVVMIDPQLKFLVETGLLVAFSALLYRWLFVGAERSLHLLVLVGIVFGVFSAASRASCSACSTPMSIRCCRTCCSPASIPSIQPFSWSPPSSSAW